MSREEQLAEIFARIAMRIIKKKKAKAQLTQSNSDTNQL
jgi:hypothetical protein